MAAYVWGNTPTVAVFLVKTTPHLIAMLALDSEVTTSDCYACLQTWKDFNTRPCAEVNPSRLCMPIALQLVETLHSCTILTVNAKVDAWRLIAPELPAA